MRRGLLLLAVALAACDPEPVSRPGKRAGTRGDPFGAVEAAPATAAALGYRQARALVVGVSRYASPSLGSLDGTVFDAEEVAALLSSRYGMKTTLLVDREGPPLTRARLLEALAALKKDVGRDDALLFFYAGHGVPGRLVPADAEPARDPAAWKNLVSFAELGAALRACDAHHTLVVLDSCFSGSALAEGSPLREAVGTLGDASLRVAEADNLARVFNRRSFQVLTAGTGAEEVEDLAKLSRDYAGLGKDLEKHSPFTGVFLQALRGLTGRPDGRVPASDLGYYLKHTLVNENAAFKARQQPLFGNLGGGDGDFLFLPAQRVLNPRLVAPLYMPGAEYAELRTSACAALAEFVETGAPDREALAAAAVPHVARLLRDERVEPRKAAARAVARLAPLSAEFARCVPILGALLGEQAADDEKDLAAEALGALAPFADEKAVAAMSAYGARHRARFFERVKAENLEGRPWPQEFYDRYAAVGPSAPAPDDPPAARMKVLEKIRAVDAWANAGGIELLKRLDRRHQEGRTLLEKAEKAAADKSYFDARRGVEAASPFLWPNSEEWTRGQELLRTTPDLRPLWRVAPPAQHEGEILRMAASGDGRRVATWGEDGAVRWWNAATGALEGELPRAAHRMAGMALSDDGRRLIWATEAGELERWDLERRSKIAEIRMLRGVRSLVALDGAAAKVAVGMFEGVIGLLDPAEDPEKAVYLRDAGSAVMLLAMHRGSNTLVSYGRDGRLRLWEAATGKPRSSVPALPKGEEEVETLAVFEERAELVWTCGKGAVCAASLAGEPAPRGLATCSSPPYAIAAAGETLVLAMAEVGVQAVRLPGLDSLWVNATIVPAEVGRLRRMAARHDLLLRKPPLLFSPDRGRLWVGRGAGLVSLDPATGREAPGGRRGRIAQAAYSPDGRRIVSAGDRLLFWDGGAPRAIEHEGQAGVAAWMYPDGRRVLLVLERRLLCLEAASEALVWTADLAPGAQVRLSRDGKEVVAAEGTRVRILDGATGERRREWTWALGVEALALHPGGRLAALGGTDKWPAAALVDLADGRELWRHHVGQALFGGTGALAFDPSGLLLAAGDEDGRVSVWKVRTGELFEGLGATDLVSVRALAFSPDGLHLAAAGREVRVWDVFKKKELVRFTPSSGGVLSAAYSPDGRSILAVGLDGGLSLWALGLAPETVRLPPPPSGSAELALAPAGDIYVASGQHALNVCSTRTGEVLASVPADSPDDVTFSRDGRRLAAVEEGRLRVYEAQGLRKLAEFPAKHGALSPDGGKVVVLRAHEGKVLDLEGKELGSFRGLKGADLSRAAFVLDGAVLSGDDTGEVRLWVPGEAETRRFVAPTGDGIFFLKASSDGRRAVAAGLHGQAMFFDFAAKRSTSIGPVRRKSLSHLEFSPDGRSLAFGWSDGAVCVWDLERGAARIWIWLEDYLSKPSWHPDGRRLFAAHIRRHGVLVLDLDLLAAPLPEAPRLSRSLKDAEAIPAFEEPPGPAELVLRYQDLDAARAVAEGVDAPLRRLLNRRLEGEALYFLAAGQIEAARARFAQAGSTSHDATFQALQAVREGRWADAAPLLAEAKGLDENEIFVLRVAAARKTKDVEGEKALRDAFVPKPGTLAGVVRFVKGQGTSKQALDGDWEADDEGRIHAYLALLGEPGQAEEARRLLKAESFELDLLR